MKVVWSSREVPLAPTAVVGRGRVAKILGRRILEGGGGPWLAAVSKDLLIVEGEDLPWVDGVVFLGRQTGSSVLHDTRLEANLSPDLLSRAVARRCPGRVAWLFEPEVLVPLGALDQVDPARLAAWVVS